MKKILIGLLTMGTLSAFAGPINILGCQSETKFVHIRLLSENTLDVTVTSGSDEMGTESYKTYSAELNDDELMMVKGGSWTVSVFSPEGRSVTLSINHNTNGQIIGDGYPEFLNCHKLASKEMFGY